MEDEQQLASLVLLLKLSTTTSPQNKNAHNDDKQPSVVDNDSTPLQKELEKSDCSLLLFIGRLINAYNNAATHHSTEQHTQLDKSYAFLRLAIHVLFLRYTEETSENNYTNKNNDNNHRVVECEQYLLRNLLPATLRARASLEIEEVDVEILWIMRSMLLLLHDKLGGGELLWVDFIEVLVTRCMLKRESDSLSPSLQNVANVNGDDEDDDVDKMMIQVIHSILDGGIQSTTKPSDDNGSGWNLEFNKGLVDCIQMFLTYVDAASGRDGLRLRGSTVFRLIQFSQQSNVFSVHVYMLVLQYLRLCMQSSNSPASSFRDCFMAREGVQDDSKSEEIIAASIRSFVFYGIVVLGNTVESSSSNIEQESTDGGGVTSTRGQISTKGLRVEIYTIAMDLWRSFGPTWLFYDPMMSSSPTLNSDFWWFRSKSTDSHLGATWPLCTLVQLAAGDLRLNLGRWITIAEDSNMSSYDNERVCSEVESCATVILETVQLMTSLADDEADITSGVWVPEALLHIRKSLEDALNSSVQCLNALSCAQDEARAALSDQADNVGRICCVLVGTIASELEVEDLLISPSIDERNMQLTKEAEASCFAFALSTGMLLCNDIGGKNARNAERLEASEPLCCLLPCIMSVVACSCSNESVQAAITSLDGSLVYVMSRFLHRTGERWELLDKQTQIDEVDTILSITGLCLLIIEELVTLSSSPRSGYQELTAPLIAWKETLLKVESDAEDALEEHIAKTLEQVDNCLILLKTYQ